MEKQIDYAEQLLEAMKVVSQAEVQGVSFDKTIQCTVVDIKDAETGTYMVNNGSANFIAYSKDTDYKIDDVVLVTIPQGDYNQQKIIIGKYITKNSTPFVYKNPFDYFVDITGNLVSNSHEEYSILANNVPTDIICPEGPVALWTCLGTKTHTPLVGYDTMGIKAEFMTLLRGFKVVSGNYGLRVLVTYLNNATNVDDNADFLNKYNAHLNNKNSSLLIRKINTVLGNLGGAPAATVSSDEREVINKLYSQKNYYFDIDDMYGDPYDYDTYYQQQVLFNISDVDKIVAIQVDLYQSWDEENNQVVGSFKDNNGRRILWYDEVFTDELYMDNIYTKDIYLALGYNESQFDTDKLILYTQDNETYSVDNTDEINKKTIQARWIHKDDTGEILIIDDLSNFPGSQLNWYRYRQNEGAADVYSGVSWVKLTSSPRTEDGEFYAKTINNGWGCEMVPSTQIEKETIKAILIYGQNKIVRSSLMEFINEDEVPSGATVKQLNDFYLVPLDGLNGVYNLYDNEEKIVSQTLNNDSASTDSNLVDPSLIVRQLAPRLKDSELHDIEYIKWSIPWEYTMLIPCGPNGEPIFSLVYNDQEQRSIPQIYPENLPETVLDNKTIRWNYYSDRNYIYLVYPLDPNQNEENLNPSVVTNIDKIDDFNWNFYYRINNTYIQSYNNNSITCEIVQDRIIYSYTYNFRFGLNGTNGSDYTLDLSFIQTDPKKMPETAINVEDNNAQLKIHLDLWKKNKTEPEDWNNDTLYKNVKITWDWFTCVNANSYEPAWYEVRHDNIPQYRKDWDDLNKGNKVGDDPESYNPGYAMPEYFKISNTSSSGNTYTNENIGKYSDEKDDLGEYLVHYYVQVIEKKRTTEEPHIKIYHTDGSDYDPSADNGRLTEILLKRTSNLTINELYVLRVTVKGVMSYPLVGYLSIPLYKKYNNMKPNYIGPDKVGYTSYGETKYNSNPCKMTWIGNDNGFSVVNLEQNRERFEIFIPPKGSSWFRSEDALNYANVNENYVLEPLNIYLPDNPPYGIQYFINNQVYYIQPIFCYQNQWSNGTINSWDGTGLFINEQDGYIVGHSITAGKKESDNTFTGVMLGDLSVYDNTEIYLKQNTGVYGFHHGSIAYAFKDDGTAVIGKPGHGRIEFNGNYGTIQSSAWKELNQHGMSIDLDDGIIKMIKPGFYGVLSGNDLANLENDFDNYKNKAYRFNSYTLYKSADMSVISDRQLQNDKEKLNFYLPRSFYKPEEVNSNLKVVRNNYKQYKFYRKYVFEINNNDPSFDNTDPDKELDYINSKYLENTTYVITKIDRINYSNELNTLCFCKYEYEWIYVRSQEDSSKLISILNKITKNQYILDSSGFDANAEYYLPDITNFSIVTEDEMGRFNTGNNTGNDYWRSYSWFYTYIGDYRPCKNDISFDVFETYYKLGNSDHYITVSVDHPTYPLAIGESPSEGLRKFRVTWDGYVYADHGKFAGTIEADEGFLRNLEIKGWLYTRDYKDQLETTSPPGIYGAYIEGGEIYGAIITAKQLKANIGEIGGWTITNTGLYNRQYGYGGESIGQIFLSSDTSSNGSNSGIYLYNSALKVYPYRESLAGGFMGWIGPPNESGGIGIGYTSTVTNASGLVSGGQTNYFLSDSWGASMVCRYSNETVASIKVKRGWTSEVVASGQAMIVMDASGGIQMGHCGLSSSSWSTTDLLGNVRITTRDSFAVSLNRDVQSSYYGPSNTVFEIRKGDGDYAELQCWIPSNLQYGIYARFA